MPLLILLAASLLVFALRGGTARDLAALRLRWGGLVLASCAVQLGVMYGLPLVSPWLEWRGALLMLSYLCLVIALVANWRLPWLPILIIGTGLNFAVMAANGGLMPVAPETLLEARMVRLAPGLAPGTPVAGTKDVVLPREQTRLAYLADVFVWPAVPRRAVFSAGDVLIALGAAMLLQAMVTAPRSPAWRPNRARSARRALGL
jgi:hypothetical protein